MTQLRAEGMKYRLPMKMQIWSLLNLRFIDSAVEESLDAIGEALAKTVK